MFAKLHRSLNLFPNPKARHLHPRNLGWNPEQGLVKTAVLQEACYVRSPAILGWAIPTLLWALPSLMNSWIIFAIQIDNISPYYRFLMGGGRTQPTVLDPLTSGVGVLPYCGSGGVDPQRRGLAMAMAAASVPWGS